MQQTPCATRHIIIRPAIDGVTTRPYTDSARTDLISIDGLDELGAPELHGLVEREADGFEEEAVLHAAPVLEVVGRAQALVQLLHAQRERLLAQLPPHNSKQQQTCVYMYIRRHTGFDKGAKRPHARRMLLLKPF